MQWSGAEPGRVGAGAGPGRVGAVVPRPFRPYALPRLRHLLHPLPTVYPSDPPLPSPPPDEGAEPGLPQQQHLQHG